MNQRNIRLLRADYLSIIVKAQPTMYSAEFSHTAKFGYCCVANPNIKLSKTTTFIKYVCTKNKKIL